MTPDFRWPLIRRLASVHLGMLSLALGVAFVSGGNNRFQAPTYSMLRDSASGNIWPYGVALCAVGILVSVPKLWWVNFAGHMIGVLVNAIMAGYFAAALIQLDKASPTAWVIYLGFSSLHGFVLALMWVQRHWETIYQDQG